jgi:hypothetical protein
VGEPLKRSVRFPILKQTKHLLEALPGSLRDLDLAPSGRWIAVTEPGEQQYLSFNGKTILLPVQCQFPQIAAMDDETVFLVNSRVWTEKNGWLITSSGEVKANFYAGDAIQDILISSRFIVVTYFDESALTSPGIEGNGVAIFDLKGNFLFGYRELFTDEAVDIADCYAACWGGDSHLLFFPYTDFPLVAFDLESKTQTLWEPPDIVAGSNAITALDEKVYFHSPYADKAGIYEWKMGSQSAVKIGSWSNRIRGIRHGKFLALESDGYQVLSPSEI